MWRFSAATKPRVDHHAPVDTQWCDATAAIDMKTWQKAGHLPQIEVRLRILAKIENLEWGS